MKLLYRGLALAVVGAGLAAAPTLSVQAAPAQKADDNGVRAMKNEADGLVSLSGESATRRVGFIRVKRGGDLMPSVGATSRSAAAEKSDPKLAK